MTLMLQWFPCSEDFWVMCFIRCMSSVVSLCAQGPPACWTSWSWLVVPDVPGRNGRLLVSQVPVLLDSTGPPVSTAWKTSALYSLRYYFRLFGMLVFGCYFFIQKYRFLKMVFIFLRKKWAIVGLFSYFHFFVQSAVFSCQELSFFNIVFRYELR